MVSTGCLPYATLESLRDFVLRAKSPVASLFMPIDLTSPDTRHDRLRYRGALDDVAVRLHRLGLPDAEVSAWTERLSSVSVRRDDLPHPARALAVFGDAEQMHPYAVFRRLQPRRAVGRRPIVRPLLRAVELDRRYRVVALSANRVRVFEGDEQGLSCLEIPGLPTSVQGAVGDQSEPQRVHAHTASGHERRLFVHGHGGAADAREAARDRFHEMVAKALEHHLDREAPIVLVADQVHHASFRRVASALPLVDVLVAANPDEWTPAELSARTWPVIEEQARHEITRSLAQAREVRHKVLERVDEIVLAAVAGRVRRLWVHHDRRRPGNVDEQAGRASLQSDPGDDDLLDALAVLVFKHGGTVNTCEPDQLPPSAVVAALR